MEQVESKIGEGSQHRYCLRMLLYSSVRLQYIGFRVQQPKEKTLLRVKSRGTSNG